MVHSVFQFLQSEVSVHILQLLSSEQQLKCIFAEVVWVGLNAQFPLISNLCEGIAQSIPLCAESQHKLRSAGLPHCLLGA